MSRSRRRRGPLRPVPITAAVAAVAAVAVVSLVVAQRGSGVTIHDAADAGVPLNASYQAGAGWGTGYDGQYTITNPGTVAAAGWTLAFTLPAGTKVSSLWDGSYTDTGGPVGTVGDDTLPRPQSSYGTQKFIGEQLVADYARKGFVRGRSVRLMTVAVRPGKPNAAASSFVSGIIREPLAGLRATCPVPPETPIALSSPRRTLQGILRAAAAGDAAWGSRTAMNLPALATTPRSMADAMDRVVGYAASDLIDWTDDPVIGAIVRSWPARIETPRANALGLRPEASFDDIVRAYLDDENEHRS
jgi:Cellulose binding domain